MKGKILIVVGTVIVIFAGLWIGGVLPLQMVSAEEIRTCPYNGGHYKELKNVTAITPKIIDSHKISKVLYFQDNVSVALACYENDEYFWFALIENPGTGLHEFKFEFYGFPLGDVNHDGTINGEDLNLTKKAFGTHSGDPNWNTHADLNEDGVVDIEDSVIVATNIDKAVLTKLLATVTGTFSISLIGSDSAEPELAKTQERRQQLLLQQILQITLLVLGCGLVCTGVYIEKRD